MNDNDNLHPLLKPKTQTWKVDTDHPLKEFLQQVHPTFFFSGEYIKDRWASNKKIYLRTVKDGNTDYVDAGSIHDPKVEILLQAARPSSFGKGTETVYDETIRKGKELNSGDIVVTKGYRRKGEPPEEGYFSREILGYLPTNMLDRPLKAKFYKLAIYEPGGHFHTHRDTVHGPDHIATLLVEVRSAHKGGDLIVEKDGERHVWSTATSQSEELDECKVSWCMFFTDIEHRVEPVLEGVRMVLQYDIFLSDDQDDTIIPRDPNVDRNNDIISWSRPIEELSNASAAKPEAIMKIVNYLNLHLSSNEAIAIPFFYFYANQKIAPKHLKNTDAMLFGELVKAGLSVALTPVQLHAETCFTEFVRNLPITMGIGDYPLVFYCPIESEGTVDEEGYKRKMLSSWSHDMSLTYVHSGMESSRYLSTQVFQTTCGNDAIYEGVNHYFTGAMIIIKEADVMVGKEKKRKTEEEEDKNRMAKRSHQSNNTCEGSLSEQGK